MRVIDIAVNELQEYENNPRNNDVAVDAVAASIQEFGFKVPVIIDSKMVIVAGHTRVKAAKNIGMETVPCIIADDLTPEQIKAFRLADNKVSALSNWDFTKLEEKLAGLDIDMTAFRLDAQEDVNIEDFFEDAEPKEKEPKQIQCPHCGKWFEA